ncbi:hypothetical protein G9A89_011289 [Geosiphon pyriformis]|nr:hypothetical protein G9A89_011289 [Geosiphon pyriformis]
MCDRFNPYEQWTLLTAIVPMHIWHKIKPVNGKELTNIESYQTSSQQKEELTNAVEWLGSLQKEDKSADRSTKATLRLTVFRSSVGGGIHYSTTKSELQVSLYAKKGLTWLSKGD